MADKNPKTMTYVSVVILIVLIVTGLLEARRRGRFKKTEAELIAELKAANEAAEPVAAEEEFPQDRWDPMLHAQLGRVSMRLQANISECVETKWPNHPQDARVRVVADEAGRLISLGVQNAPQAAEDCLLGVLKRGQFPRKTDGVADLVLSYR